MMENHAPFVADIRIYPIKSLDPVVMDRVEVGKHSFRNDRTFALKTADGKYINGKRTGRVNQLAATYDLANNKVFLSERNHVEKTEFELASHNPALVEFLCDFFGMRLTLVSSNQGDLLDAPISSSITLVSTESFRSILLAFPHLSLDDLRLRFRPNIEIDGVPSFWEDHLFGIPGLGRKFTIGDVAMTGISPRARCNVPPRHPFTGKPASGFMKQIIKSRAELLPKTTDLAAYGHFYHLCVNTFIGLAEEGKIIQVGDELKSLDSVQLSALGISIE